MMMRKTPLVLLGAAAGAALTLIGVDRALSIRSRPIALTILVGLLMLVNVVSALRFVIPFYYGPGGGGAFRP